MDTTKEPKPKKSITEIQKRLSEMAQKARERKQSQPDDTEVIESTIEHPKIDVSIFKPINSNELISILGQTIKRDETNKLITFHAQLSAYTEDSQINISFNAPSSTGKSFIPTEIAKLFPSDDVIEVGYCSPTAFFHDYGVLDKEKHGYIVNLSGKILIFLDQPHTLLLQHIRPMLSHDKKEIRIKITDKSQKAGLRTKNIYLIGYPTVIFCTAGLNLDEQEATRFLLLSPEINYEKIREAIEEKIKKESSSSSYDDSLKSDPDRQLLKERILAIKEEGIKEIRIANQELVKNLFFEKTKTLKPRNQRDIGRILSLIKILALLNLWFRDRDGQILIANNEDIKEAFNIWSAISESQELNLPPYVFNLYSDVILDAFKAKNSESLSGVRLGLTRQEILQKHFEVYGRFLPDWQLRQQIIPMLETAGMITLQKDHPTDKRVTLIYPTTPLTTSIEQNNSELDSGEEISQEEIEEIFREQE